MSLDQDSQAVNNFKEYLRIPSVHPDVDYNGCVEFVKRQGAELGLPVTVLEVAARKPVLVMSWIGKQPQLASLLLSSHMDVVPVFEDMWTHPPFRAEEDESGNIFARGAQDMKCVGLQYLEAIRRLKRRGFAPKRSIHVCFTSDEEIGLLGMSGFVKTEVFKKLNVGCGLDEGVASADESYHLFYADRLPCSMRIIFPGTPGHGSLLHENTAGEKFSVVVNKLLEKRAEEKKKLKDNPNLTLGDVTTINLTVITGGVQANVVPPELKVEFDIRLSPTTDFDEFNQWVEDLCVAAGEGVRTESLSTLPKSEPTKLDSSNPWWTVLKGEFAKLNLKVNCTVFPACTDASHLRVLGIPAFGFSPMNNTPVLLHDHNEFLNRKVFLKGIDIYENIISALANM